MLCYANSFPVFFYIGVDRNNLRKLNDIGIGAAPIRASRNDKRLGGGADIHFFASVEHYVGVKISDELLVFLAVSELTLDILDRRAAAFAEERRQLRGAVLAEIAVFKLAVSEKSYFLAADIAIFLIK